MDPSEQIIAAAIASGDHTTGLRRITCNTAARIRINCGCGNILDETTVTVVETIGGRVLAVYCPDCWPRFQKLWIGHNAIQWDSEETVEGTNGPSE